MAFQVPRDLIEQARIMLRKEAGLESCHPNDSSIPSLPTVEEVIAGFDPSPESLRCNHCRGKLLRGSQSLICVYCGREQKRDTSPEPIPFKSTIGFRWLLDSLGLDGSEIVDLSDEGTQSKRERYSVKDEIPLSNYLDLEMKWPDKSERLGLTDDEALENNEKNLSQLAGMDFGNSVFEEKSDRSSVPSIDQTMSNEKVVEFEAFPARGNLGLFENQEKSSGVIKPSDSKSADSWEADFQAASFVSAHEGVNSPHSSQIPPSSHSPHIAPVYEPSKDVKEGKPVNDLFSHAPFSIKRDEPDSLSDSLSGESILEGKDGVSIVPGLGGTVSGLSSVTADQNQCDGKALELVESVRGIRDVSPDSDFKTAAYEETDQRLASGTIVSTRDGNFDSSNAWDAFTALAESVENQHQTSSISAPEEDSLDAWNDFAGPGTVLDSQPVNRDVNSAEEKSVCVGSDVFGQWNDVASLNNTGGSQCEVSDEKLVLTKKVDHRDTVGLSGEFSSLAEQDDRLQGTGVASTADIMIKKGENASNLWGDFTGSAGAQRNAGGNNGLELARDQINGEGDDVSDHWGDFTGLTNSGSSEQFFKSTDVHGDINISKDNDDMWGAFTSPVRGSEIKLANEETPGAWDDVFKPSIQYQANHQQASQVEAIHEGDDSSNSWSDFRSSSNAISGQTPSHVDLSVNNTTSDDLSSHALNDFPSSMLQAKQEHASQKTVSENDTAKHDDLFDSWGSFSSSSVAQGNQLQNSGARMSQADDIFGGWNSNAGSTTAVDNQLMIGGTLAPDVRKTGKGEETYDPWSDFTSSANLPSNQLKAMENHGDDKQDATQADPFDSWNFLISSSSSQSNNKDISSSEHVYTNMLNSSGMNSSLQPAPFPDTAIDRSGSGNIGIQSAEAHDSSRTKDEGAISDHPVSRKDETGSVQTSEEQPIDAEALISQMHDLSFMLESSLSIPKKGSRHGLEL